MLARPSWGRLAAAVAVCAASAWTRTQLAVLFAVLALGLLWLAWESGPGRRWRAGWSRWDWAGAITLAFGAVLAFSALMGHLSTSWRKTTFIYKDRIFEHATWAIGALAIGIGVLPLIVGMAALARPQGEPRDPETRAFVVTSAAALGAFVWYAGIKGAYVSTVFATYVYERNVIYLAPVLFAATALAFTRGVGRAWAIAVAAVVTLYVVNAVPIVLQYPYYEAHGLAILAFANRELGWSEDTIGDALVVVSLVALAIVVTLRLVRRWSLAFGVLAGMAAIAVVSWSMTTQVYAAEGERILSRQVAAEPSEALRLGRTSDRWRLGRRPRAADLGRHRRLADRVLQSLDPQGVEPRRHCAQSWSDPDAGPGCHRRDTHAPTRRRLRAFSERSRAPGSDRGEPRTQCPLPRRRQAHQAPGGVDRP